jgi:crotonobetainyl-CoA hydratase
LTNTFDRPLTQTPTHPTSSPQPPYSQRRITIDTEVLLEERIGDVLKLTMNRVAKHNALNAELDHAIGSAVSRADDDGVRVIVLTGAGEKAFCAGADMLEASGVETSSGTLPPPAERQHGDTEVARTPIPVIAAINGYCYGGGARLAIECDILLAAEHASFRLPGAEYGLVVAAATLPRLVGVTKAKEWIFTARRFDAAEAHAAGMLSHLYPAGELLPAAMAMAETIAGQSAGAVRESKRAMDAATLVTAARDIESSANKVLRGSKEQSERFRSATKKVTGR